MADKKTSDGQRDFPDSAEAEVTAAAAEEEKPETPELPEDPGEGLPDPGRVGRTQFVIDVLERAVATYLETLSVLLFSADKLSISYITAAAIAAGPAGLSVVKAGVARFLGDPGTAAFVPRRVHNWAARRSGQAEAVLPARKAAASQV